MRSWFWPKPIDSGPWPTVPSSTALSARVALFLDQFTGHVVVQPRGERGRSLDLVELVKGLAARDLNPPVLIRFDDILEDRLERLHAAFDRAISLYDYDGRYQGVFPIKCNQQRHVVEQLVDSGQRWGFGLEAGSKAELLIALSLMQDQQALLICNGYKDRRCIETAILARRWVTNWW